MSSWSKDSKNGTRYLSLAFKPKDAPAAKPAASPSNDDLAPTPVAGSARAEPARETPPPVYREQPKADKIDDSDVPF